MPRGVYKRTPEHRAAISAGHMRNKKPGWFHGTANGYNNHKCRCDECRAAWAAYYGEYRRAQAEIKRELDALSA